MIYCRVCHNIFNSCGIEPANGLYALIVAARSEMSQDLDLSVIYTY